MPRSSRAVERFGGLDIAVANAGIAPQRIETISDRRPTPTGSGSSTST